jgi:hypothetical protein
MKRLLIAAAALVAAVAALPTPAVQAQSYGYGAYNSGYGYRAPQRRSWGYYRSYGGQADVPGDYRCDAFWDANRNDCGARWRDQRSYGQRWNTGYGHGYSGGGYGYGGGYYGRGRGYGSGGYGYGYAPQGQAYYGAYGRPDLIYPGGDYGGGYGYQTSNGPRNPGRIAYCQSRFRSYDPNSGFYRGYSGRLIFCG